jgi:hypothetical protein
MLYRIRLLVAFSVVLSGGALAEQRTGGLPIQPNQEVQSFLHALSSTNAQERRKVFPVGEQEEFRQKLAELQDKAGGAQKFVLQLLYFSAHARSMRQGMLPLVVVDELNISADDRAAAIVPLLDTGDQAVLEQAYEWLQVVDFDGETRELRFSRHENVLRRETADVPKGLIRYMYATSPDAALSSLATVYLDKDAAKALVDRVKGENDAQAVDHLSQRPEWWAQLYVAEKLRKNPKLHSVHVLERIKGSDHPLVKEKVAEITSGK